MVVHTTRPWLRRFDLTYTPPKSSIRRFFWQQRMRFEGAFALSLLEPWEKFLIMTLLLALSYVFLVGTFKYLPHHLDFLRQRATYYLETIRADEL